MASEYRLRLQSEARLLVLRTGSAEAANAPELDRTVLVREWGGDSTTPEVDFLNLLKIQLIRSTGRCRLSDSGSH